METGKQGHNPFYGLAGQEQAKQMLSRSLCSERIAHAYLFRGPDGVGKARFAGNMAKALNCREYGPAMWCGRCSSCVKFQAGSHPDFILEKPEKQAITIDRVREIVRSLSYQPYESRFRVVVFEDVHTMRAEAANCLLKTLEEPPENNILILTAEAAKEVLQTIVSRCQVLSFFPLTYQEASQILVANHGVEEEEADILARLAEGSPGKALLLQKMKMIPLYKKVTAHLNSCKGGDERHQGKTMQLAEELAQLKETLPLFLGLLRLWLRDSLLAEEDDDSFFGEIMKRIEAVDKAERQLERNCNRALVCEILLFRLQSCLTG